ncbi:MAG TPA: class I SAM-dependent methyltransferase, partial [Opitutaceae bacterium]|nr:class I SAM-dependent methyltransferase [Opitutaceae bacterium]
ARAARLGLRNLQIRTCDMNDFIPETGIYDRVVSVEMFEHMKNWPRLLERIARSLKPSGLFFLHIFTHERFSYHFEVRDQNDWMSQYFFTGGMMPSAQLLSRFQEHLQLRRTWTVPGQHYQQTAECWLKKMDASRPALTPLFSQTYGQDADLWWSYWRIFFMSCAELWGWNEGKEWTVTHYLMEKR